MTSRRIRRAKLIEKRLAARRAERKRQRAEAAERRPPPPPPPRELHRAPPDAPEGLRAWFERVDYGAVYGLAPPDDDLALADAFVASLDGADRELAYAAVLLACRFVGRRSRSWRVFDVASFACMELGAYFEGTLEERSAVLAILEGFFAWQSARGALSEGELAIVRANLEAAREAVEAAEDYVLYGNVLDPTTGEPLGG